MVRANFVARAHAGACAPAAPGTTPEGAFRETRWRAHGAARDRTPRCGRWPKQLPRAGAALHPPGVLEKPETGGLTARVDPCRRRHISGDVVVHFSAACSPRVNGPALYATGSAMVWGVNGAR